MASPGSVLMTGSCWVLPWVRVADLRVGRARAAHGLGRASSLRRPGGLHRGGGPAGLRRAVIRSSGRVGSSAQNP